MRPIKSSIQGMWPPVAGSHRNRLAVLSAAIALVLAFGGGSAWATDATLTGGEGAEWFVHDEFLTSNGQPAGGFCSTGPAGSGASVVDADLLAQGDAFDDAAATFVDGTLVGGLLTATGREANFAPVSISGLSVQVEMRALSSQSTLRTLVKLTNPTSSTISVPVQYVNNFGSDGSTQITDSSTGDTSFSTADRFVVTDDSSTLAGDPANTTVLYGSGNPPVTTSAASQTVLDRKSVV